jgi:hypothetical protein
MGVLVTAECPNGGYTARIGAGYGAAGIEWEPHVCRDAARSSMSHRQRANSPQRFRTSTSALTVAARTSSLSASGQPLPTVPHLSRHRTLVRNAAR